MFCAHTRCLLLLGPLCFFHAEGSLTDKEAAYTFDDYKAAFDRQYEAGSAEHETRQALFDARLKEIHAHNAKGASWKMGVNHLTDLTEEELGARNGYKPGPRARSDSGSSSLMQTEPGQRSCGSHQASCLETESTCCDGLICGSEGVCLNVKSRPDELDWTPQLETSETVLEQGRCGSCWAVSATAALQFHAELWAQRNSRRFTKILSPQAMLSCTPNEHECGGQGGCHGATAELGYEWLKSNGRVLDIESQPYKAENGQCSTSFLRSAHGVSVGGWHKIPENDADAMMDSLVNIGPLVASIAAKGMHMYDSGVMSHLDDENLVLNHAVVMMGYGEENGMYYWKLRNSWGDSWGEKGYFRVQRFAPKGKEPCGVDTDPGKGVVCKDDDGNYPETQRVCGTAGVLADTAYPVGTSVSSSMLEDGRGSTRRVPGISSLDSERSTVVIDAKGSINEKDEQKDGVWCKTRCQHFEMEKLAATYNMDFGDDPGHCAKICDKVFRRGSFDDTARHRVRRDRRLHRDD